MFVAGSAAAEKRQRLITSVPEFVLFSRWNRDGVSGFDLLFLGFNAHASLAMGNEVNFLGFRVEMFLG